MPESCGESEKQALTAFIKFAIEANQRQAAERRRSAPNKLPGTPTGARRPLPVSQAKTSAYSVLQRELASRREPEENAGDGQPKPPDDSHAPQNQHT